MCNAGSKRHGCSPKVVTPRAALAFRVAGTLVRRAFRPADPDDLPSSAEPADSYGSAHPFADHDARRPHGLGIEQRVPVRAHTGIGSGRQTRKRSKPASRDQSPDRDRRAGRRRGIGRWLRRCDPRSTTRRRAAPASGQPVDWAPRCGRASGLSWLREHRCREHVLRAGARR